MKTCEHVKGLLPLYIDNGLDKDELKFVEDHAIVCEECQSELELYRNVQETLFLDDIDLPANFHRELVEKLRLQNETDGINVFYKSFFSKYTKYANLAAIFVLVLFLSIIGLSKYNVWDEFPLNSQKTSSTMETATEETKTEAMESPQLSMVAPQEAMESSTVATSQDETAATERTTNDSVLVDSKTDEKASTLAAPQLKDEETNDVPVTESIYGSEPDGESDGAPLNNGFFILLTILTLGGSVGLVWLFFKHRK